MYWENTNKLLYHGFNGIKTGNTSEAGPCLASSYSTDKNNYILVVLGCKSTDHRWNDTMSMLEWVV